MAPIATTRKPLAPRPVEGVNFGDLGFYSGGFSLPEGDYALEFNAVMFAGTKQDGTPAGPERLGVMVNAHPLRGGDMQQQFFSMGSKAHLSFAPNPETGKGLVPVPGGPASGANNKTNWFLFLKSMYDCGLPQGIFSNDLIVLDGIHVHTQQVPEPEDRKGFQAQTGEAAQEERRSGMVPIVSAILDDGKPWEGTGGIPEADAPAPAPVAKLPVKLAPKAPVKPIARVAPVAAASVAEATDDEGVMTAAINGVTEVLTASPNGISKLLLRTGTFKAVTAVNGGPVAQQVLDTYFQTDEALNSILNQLGYASVGGQVKPA